MTFSIELLPAPLGPMIARISCSRTSKLMPDRAFTPPNESEIPWSRSTTSPMFRREIMGERRCLRSRLRGCSREMLRGGNCQIRGDHSAAAILELHLGLNVLPVLAVVQGIDQHGVFLGYKSAPHFARARQFVVVGIELLVQDEKAMDLGRRERAFAGELGVHLLDAFADQRIHLRLGSKIGVPGGP